MFCTYVRPILEYNSACWSPCLIKDIVKVESVQRRFTKRIPGLHDYSYLASPLAQKKPRGKNPGGPRGSTPGEHQTWGGGGIFLELFGLKTP